MIVYGILSGIGGVLILVFIVAAFTKKEYAVQRTIRVHKPKEEVFHFISSIRNQDSFSKWANLDPNMKKEYKGEDRTVGFISKWESPQKNVGQGEQEIIKITPGERIDTEIRFLKPMRAVGAGFLATHFISDNETEVSWGMSSRMNYPFNFLLLVIPMKKMLGNDFQEGLENMKRQIEA